MYDLEKEFETFYKDYVVLSSEKQQELRNKKDINITHLKNGLAEINEENGTSYAVAETRVQGSEIYRAIYKKGKRTCKSEKIICCR